MASRNVLAKLYRSRFRANGVTFGDTRAYVAGDDTRLINWNVTAKMGIPFVNGIAPDSGNDIIFAVDLSQSMQFGTRKRSKIALISDIVVSLARLAEVNGDRVGLVAFSSSLEKFLPPRRASKIFPHAMANAIRRRRSVQTDVCGALRFLNGTIKKQSLIILCCDTFGLASGRKSILAQLHMLRSKHSVIAITAVDDGDMPPAKIGTVTVEDAETGITFDVDTDDAPMMEKIKSKYAAYVNLIAGDIEKLGVENFTVNTKDSVNKFLFTLLR
jgi:uncharacterized protein (DUF58 family)